MVKSDTEIDVHESTQLTLFAVTFVIDTVWILSQTWFNPILYVFIASFNSDVVVEIFKSVIFSKAITQAP